MGADYSVVVWEEQDKAPDNVTAKARGARANLVNTDRPARWSANRTRPLCASEAGTHNGPGDVETASSFAASDGGLVRRRSF